MAITSPRATHACVGSNAHPSRGTRERRQRAAHRVSLRLAPHHGSTPPSCGESGSVRPGPVRWPRSDTDTPGWAPTYSSSCCRGQGRAGMPGKRWRTGRQSWSCIDFSVSCVRLRETRWSMMMMLCSSLRRGVRSNASSRGCGNGACNSGACSRGDGAGEAVTSLSATAPCSAVGTRSLRHARWHLQRSWPLVRLWSCVGL